MKIAVFPGSFDPVTLGHLNLIERAARIFDHVYVCTVPNGEKHGMFTPEQRLEMLRLAVAGLNNVTAELWPGLLTDYAKEKGAQFLVRGSRNGTCFEEEYALAQIYRGLDPELDTIVLPAEPKYLHFSSTMVRELIKYHKALEDYMPSAAAKYVNQLMKG